MHRECECVFVCACVRKGEREWAGRIFAAANAGGLRGGFESSSSVRCWQVASTEHLFFFFFSQ